METSLEFLRAVLKGIVREVSAYFFRKNILENKKTTPRRHKHKGGSKKRNNIFDNHHPDGRGCMEKCDQHFSLLVYLIIYEINLKIKLKVSS